MCQRSLQARFTQLYIWDVENDGIIYYNFASGKNDQVNYKINVIVTQNVLAFFSLCLIHRFLNKPKHLRAIN